MKEFCKRGHPRTPDNTGKGNVCLLCKSIREDQQKLKLKEELYYRDNVHYRDADRVPWEWGTKADNERRAWWADFMLKHQKNAAWEARAEEIADVTTNVLECHICGDYFGAIGRYHFRATCQRKLCIDINHFSGRDHSQGVSHHSHYGHEAIKHYARVGLSKHINLKQEKKRSWENYKKGMKPLLNALARVCEMHYSMR